MFWCYIADTPNNYLGTSTDFTFDLSEPLNNVVSITVGSVEIPRTWYPFNEQFGTNSFEMSGNPITIPEGFYDTTADITSSNPKSINRSIL